MNWRKGRINSSDGAGAALGLQSWAPQHSSCWDTGPGTAPTLQPCSQSLGRGLSRHTPPKGSALQADTFLGQHSPGTPPHFTPGPRGLDWDQLGEASQRERTERSREPRSTGEAKVQELHGHSHTASNLDVLPCSWLVSANSPGPIWLSCPIILDKLGCPAYLPHSPGQTWMSCPPAPYPGQTWVSCPPAPQPRTNLDGPAHLPP